MIFRSTVEPPEPMRGLEVPEDVVRALGAGKRPNVTITINGHSWRSRVAIMRGRYLIGLSTANRTSARVSTGDTIDVDVELDTAPRLAVEPEDLTSALRRDPRARAAYDALSESRRREIVRNIDSAKKPETRVRRINATLTQLTNPSATGRAPRSSTTNNP